MKKYVFIVMVILMAAFCFCGCHQDKIDGFWGLKFGESKAAVVNSLKKRFGEDMKLEDIKRGDVLIIKNVEFGGITFKNAFLSFSENKLYGGYFVTLIEYEDKDSAINIYSSIEANLRKKYGEPNKSDSATVLDHKWGESNRTEVWLKLDEDNGKYVAISLSYEDYRLKKNSIEDY